MTSKIKKTFFTIGLAILFLFQSCQKDDVDHIYAEPGYAIGTISSYDSSPFKVTYYYNFTANGTGLTGEEVAKGIGQLDKSLVGRSFLVVYKLSNLTDNDINFNYPITSQQQFEELVESFKTNPPNQD